MEQLTATTMLFILKSLSVIVRYLIHYVGHTQELDMLTTMNNEMYAIWEKKQ